MRKLLIVLLLLNAVCLLAICQPLAVLAGSGSGGGSDPCSADPTKYALDSNDDGAVDLSDFVYGLSWLFSGGTAPRVCLDTTDLEASLAQAEEERDTFEMYLDMVVQDNFFLQSLLFDCADAVELLEADLAAAQADLEAANAERDSLQVQLTQTQGELEACLSPSIPGFTFVETNTQGYDEYTHDASGIRFVHLPGCEFEMGSPVGEEGRDTDEGPVHTVTLSPFLIAKYEVTQAEYEGVMAGNTAGLAATPSLFTGGNLPVERVSWDDLHLADSFLERTGLALPSEAQWEYACRAGTSGPYAGNGNLDDMGWYSGNGNVTTHDVGGKQANDFGLHDMHGNVLEWCEDVYKSDFYADDVPGFDPVSTTGSGDRVLRGGAFGNLARAARSAFRGGLIPTFRGGGLGFRPAMPLP